MSRPDFLGLGGILGGILGGGGYWNRPKAGIRDPNRL